MYADIIDNKKIPKLCQSCGCMIQNVIILIVWGRLSHRSNYLQVVLIIQTIAQNVAKTLQSSLQGVGDCLFPCLLDAERLGPHPLADPVPDIFVECAVLQLHLHYRRRAHKEFSLNQ